MRARFRFDTSASPHQGVRCYPPLSVPYPTAALPTLCVDLGLFCWRLPCYSISHLVVSISSFVRVSVVEPSPVILAWVLADVACLQAFRPGTGRDYL